VSSALALALVFGATAAARTGEPYARPKTLAKVRGSIEALAQDGPNIAWLRDHTRPVQILNVRTRRLLTAGSLMFSRGCWRCGLLDAIAVGAGGRVLWQEETDGGNTYLVVSVLSAAPRRPRSHNVAGTDMSVSSDPDWVDPDPRGLPIAADGKAMLFYADCGSGDLCGRRRSPGIYRLESGRLQRLARVRCADVVQCKAPTALAVSGQRFAVATNSLSCCTFVPAWSHDGKRIAWIYHGDLWTIGADGAGDRQIARDVSLAEIDPDPALRPSWAPDNAQLVFERVGRVKFKLRSLGIYRVAATGGGLRRLGAGTAPAWSPDGNKIAIVRGKDVYTIDPAGGSAKRLTTVPRTTAAPLSWSPDSTRIAASRAGRLYSVRADGGGETRLTTSARAESEPAWSPDGTRIACVDGAGIAIVNADGSGERRLTNGGDVAPVWSPDSRTIAFLRDNRMFLVNADRTGLRRLTSGGMYSGVTPQWAPGAAIVVGDAYQDPGGYPSHPGIRVVSPLNGKEKKLAPVARSPVQIRDSATGRLIKRFAITGHAYAAALGPSYIAVAREARASRAPRALQPERGLPQCRRRPGDRA
jgi:hypothetical protein